MSDKVVLGIHSAVSDETQRNGNAYDRFVDGHAWLTVTRDGQTQFYGLWPDGHPRVKDNGADSDIRVGLEARARSSADRYYELSPGQVFRLESALKANVTWGPTTTCAGWASDTVTEITGKRLDATEFLSIETPRELVKTIKALEANERTAPNQPLAPIRHEPSSNTFGALTAPGGVPVALEPLHRQSIAAVERLERMLGRRFDATSERMAYSATQLAVANGLSRIDHIVLSEQNEFVRRGENVFVVQGALNDPAHRIARMKTQDAIDMPVERSMEQLYALREQHLWPDWTQSQERALPHGMAMS